MSYTAELFYPEKYFLYTRESLDEITGFYSGLMEGVEGIKDLAARLSFPVDYQMPMEGNYRIISIETLDEAVLKEAIGRFIDKTGTPSYISCQSSLKGMLEELGLSPKFTFFNWLDSLPTKKMRWKIDAANQQDEKL